MSAARVEAIGEFAEKTRHHHKLEKPLIEVNTSTQLKSDSQSLWNELHAKKVTARDAKYAAFGFDVQAIERRGYVLVCATMQRS